MNKEQLEDDLFIAKMFSELEQQMNESQAETELRWHGSTHGSTHESPRITLGEFAGDFN